MKKKILQTVLFLGIMFLTFLYVTPWTESVRNLSGSKKYVSSVPDCSGRTGVIFCLRRGQHDLVSAHIHAKKKQTVRQPFSVLLEKKRYVLCGVVSNIRLLDFFIRASHHPQQVGSRCSFII